MSYTARSTRGGPPTSASSRDLIITKCRGERDVDNNAYLLRCRATDEQVLIDAADDAGPHPRRWSARTA